ncbi:MAG TPA: PIN domain-containing protein [bacterium]|nr:PIN domain-containing protein [bacterium]
MPDQFKHLWPLSEDELKDIWNNGTIIFDTNIYLNIYRLQTKEREGLIKTIENEKILGRIWVPHQVAKEFFDARIKLIDDQITEAKKVSKYFNDIDVVLKNIINSIDGSQGSNSVIQWDELNKNIEKVLSEAKKRIKDDIEKYPISRYKDPYLDRIICIMRGRIGQHFNDDDLRDLFKEADGRYSKKTPPGYCDNNKEGENKYGDFLIWKQTINEMGKRNQHTLFVTQDDKEDWWLLINGQRIGPRPELRKEYKAETGKDIHFVSYEYFIRGITKHTSVGLDDQSQSKIVEALKMDNTISKNDRIKYLFENQMLRLVMENWFLRNYEQNTIDVSTDSILNTDDSKQTCVPIVELMNNYPTTDLRIILDVANSISKNHGYGWIKRNQSSS